MLKKSDFVITYHFGHISSISGLFLFKIGSKCAHFWWVSHGQPVVNATGPNLSSCVVWKHATTTAGPVLTVQSSLVFSLFSVLWTGPLNTSCRCWITLFTWGCGCSKPGWSYHIGEHGLSAFLVISSWHQGDRIFTFLVAQFFASVPYYFSFKFAFLCDSSNISDFVLFIFFSDSPSYIWLSFLRRWRCTGGHGCMFCAKRWLECHLLVAWGCRLGYSDDDASVCDGTCRWWNYKYRSRQWDC